MELDLGIVAWRTFAASGGYKDDISTLHEIAACFSAQNLAREHPDVPQRSLETLESTVSFEIEGWELQ